MHLHIILVTVLIVSAGAISRDAAHATTYNPPHVPLQSVPPTPDYLVPWWMGGFVTSANETTNWTLPLTYPNGGRTPVGATLIIQNQGPFNITLYATSPETIQGLPSYLIVADSTVSILTSPDWVVVSNTFGYDASSGVFTNLKVTNHTELNGDVVASGPILINSDSSACTSGFVAGTARDTCLYRAAPGVWTFNNGSSLRVPGYACVGCISAPQNTLVGDFSSTRINIGNDATIAPALKVAQFSYTDTTTLSGVIAGTQLTAVYAPTAVTTASARGQGILLTVSPTVDSPSFTAIGARTQLIYNGNASLSSGGGALIAQDFTIGFTSPFLSPAVVAKAACIVALGVTGGTATGTLTNTVLIDVRNWNGGTMTYTNVYGIDVQALSNGAAITVGARIAAPTSAATNKAAIQLSDTAGTSAGGIAWGAFDFFEYRCAAGTKCTTGNARLAGYISAGSITAPTNTAVGSFSTTTVSPTLQAFGAVTANAASGLLAFTVTTAAVTCQTATVTNTNVASTSEVILTIQSYSGTQYTNGIPRVFRSNTAGSSTGSFIIQLCNDHATNALSGNLYVAFWILN